MLLPAVKCDSRVGKGREDKFYFSSILLHSAKTTIIFKFRMRRASGDRVRTDLFIIMTPRSVVSIASVQIHRVIEKKLKYH